MKDILPLAALAVICAPCIWWLLREDLGKLPDGTDRINRWWLP